LKGKLTKFQNAPTLKQIYLGESMENQIICPDCFHNLAAISPLYATIWVRMIDIVAFESFKNISILDDERGHECLKFLEESGYITTTDCNPVSGEVIKIKVFSIDRDGKEEFCLMPDIHCEV
jgi:hypothetical protein